VTEGEYEDYALEQALFPWLDMDCGEEHEEQACWVDDEDEGEG